MKAGESQVTDGGRVTFRALAKSRSKSRFDYEDQLSELVKSMWRGEFGDELSIAQSAGLYAGLFTRSVLVIAARGSGTKVVLPDGPDEALAILTSLSIDDYRSPFREAYLENIEIFAPSAPTAERPATRRSTGHGDDKLTGALRQSFTALKRQGQNPTWREVVHHLASSDHPSIRVDFEAKKITWRDSEGATRATSFARVPNRMIGIRKDFPS